MLLKSRREKEKEREGEGERKRKRAGQVSSRLLRNYTEKEKKMMKKGLVSQTPVNEKPTTSLYFWFSWTPTLVFSLFLFCLACGICKLLCLAGQ